MRKLTLLLFALSLLSTVSAQLSQPGRVVLQNSGNKTLVGVQVVAYGAAPTDSDNEGRFSLTFGSGVAGDLVPLKEVYKKGYELVNRRETERWILSSTEMVIVMAPTGMIRQAREHYYGIGNSRYISRHEATVAEIEALKNQKKITQDEYSSRLEEAYNQLDNSQKLLEQYSDLFARVNRDELDETGKRAFELINRGRLDEAIALYEELKLVEKLNFHVMTRQQHAEELHSMIPSLKRYADICIFAGGRENLSKAGEVYLAIVESDPTDYENLVAYGHFLTEVLDYPAAIKWLTKAVDIAPTKLQIADALIDLGEVCIESRDYTPAVKYIERGIEIYHAEKGESEAYYRSHEAFAYMNLGSVYWHAGDMEKAEKAIAIGKKINESYEVSDSLRYLTNRVMLDGVGAIIRMHRHLTNTLANSNENLEQESLAIIAAARQLVAMEDNSKNRILLTTALINYTGSLSTEIDSAKKEQYLLEALAIEEELAKRNPLMMLYTLSITYHQLGVLYSETGKQPQAAAYYQKALEMRQEAYQLNPNAFTAPLASMCLEMATYHREEGNSAEAMEYSKLAIGLYESVPEEYANSIIMEFCHTLYEMGSICLKTGDFAAAEKYYLDLLSRAENNRTVDLTNVIMITLSKMVKVKIAQDSKDWVRYAYKEVKFSAQNMNVPEIVIAMSYTEDHDGIDKPKTADYYRELALFLIEDYVETNPDPKDKDWVNYWVIAGELGAYYHEQEKYFLAGHAFKSYAALAKPVSYEKENYSILMARATGLLYLAVYSIQQMDFQTSIRQLEEALLDFNYLLSVTKGKKEKAEVQELIKTTQGMINDLK